ncbi:hypothetical protein [Ruminococcus sp. zg-924]|uniref:hypothetical protein n=1 Tax=Ruminococcus sp. zg-924 TaxID=2678505 RepID=UPI00210DA3D5|nr:hypothetical protein [Ruminococcus sp. zg-924]MCQ4022801.1 hypothetical protein [Ruminococcus sp. zg-924]
MDKEYILNYVNEINKAMDTNVKVELQEATLYRYALYANCIENKIICWSELFNNLSEEQKKLHIIHAYTILLDAQISRRGSINENEEFVQLLINPNKLARVICRLMNVSFLNYEELQIEIHEVKARLFPFPDPKGTFYKVGDEVREGIVKFRIDNIFMDNGDVMITATSLNGFSNNKIIMKKETEMMRYYRITKPVEFENN